MKSHFLFICLISYSYLFSQNLDEDKYYAETKTIFIESEIFGKKRELQVFFPDEYFWHPEKKFSVLYLLDAQNFRIFNYVKKHRTAFYELYGTYDYCRNSNRR